MHKSRLQELAQRSGDDLPSYSSIREGPPHALRFKATVTFKGEKFESPEFCRTLKQAERAAAEEALEHLLRTNLSSFSIAHLDEMGACKNLLQESAQKAGIHLPVYKTDVSGPSHHLRFVTKVQVAGVTYIGNCAQTKKQAEKNAAFMAWSSLKQRALDVSNDSIQVAISKLLTEQQKVTSSSSDQDQVMASCLASKLESQPQYGLATSTSVSKSSRIRIAPSPQDQVMASHNSSKLESQSQSISAILVAQNPRIGTTPFSQKQVRSCLASEFESQPQSRCVTAVTSNSRIRITPRPQDQVMGRCCNCCNCRSESQPQMDHPTFVTENPKIRITPIPESSSKGLSGHSPCELNKLKVPSDQDKNSPSASMQFQCSKDIDSGISAGSKTENPKIRITPIPESSIKGLSGYSPCELKDLKVPSDQDKNFPSASMQFQCSKDIDSGISAGSNSTFDANAPRCQIYCEEAIQDGNDNDNLEENHRLQSSAGVEIHANFIPQALEGDFKAARLQGDKSTMIVTTTKAMDGASGERSKVVKVYRLVGEFQESFLEEELSHLRV